MESMDSLRARLEASEHQTKVIAAHTHTVERRRRWRRGIACGVGLVALLSLAPFTQAADFACAGGDVACLIDSINTANANGEVNTITLAAGTYTLTAGGLPSITSVLTLSGASPVTTILERASNAPLFQLLQISAQGALTLKGLTVQGGQCLGCRGAGLQNLGTATLHHCVVRGNSSGDFNGGGIANDGTLTIDRCTLTNNQAPEGSGGGIENRGTLLLTASALIRNAAPRGSGIANSGILLMLNSTLAQGGEGLNNVGTATVLNSTIAENLGRGLTNGLGMVALLNTLVALNAGQTPDCSGTVTSLGTNLIGDPTGCTITLQPTDLTGAPGLDTFTDDGTPGNGHFPLLPSSQAIDAGNSPACPRMDQLGKRRIGRCDIGATRFLDGSDVR